MELLGRPAVEQHERHAGARLQRDLEMHCAEGGLEIPATRPIPGQFSPSLPAAAYGSLPPLPPATRGAPGPSSGGGAEADPRSGTTTRCLPYNDAFAPYRQTGE
jgi:hypothetical protein